MPNEGAENGHLRDMHFGVLVTKNCRVIATSSGMEEISGFPKRDLVNSCWHTLMKPLDLTGKPVEAEPILSNKETVRKLSILCGDGVRKRVSVQVIPYHVADEEFVCVVMGEDRTQLSVEGVLLNDCLRNGLSVIRAAAQMSLQAVDEKNVQRRLSSIIDEVDRLDRITKEVLLF